MKFIQLCALFIGAFLFLQPSNAFATQDPPDGVTCKSGETWLPSLQACGIVAPDQSCKLNRINAGYPFGNTKFYTVAELDAAVAGKASSSTPPNCANLSVGGTRIKKVFTQWEHDFKVSCPSPFQAYVYQDIVLTQNHENMIATRGTNDSCTVADSSPSVTTETVTYQIVYELSEEVECPSSHPLGPSSAAPPNELNQWCYRIPERLPCDCSELQGMAALPSPSFLALKGAYTDGNTPECLDVADSETGQKCQCQFLAKKWLNFYAGETYERWEPYPTENGGGTGTYTGAACNAEATDTPPPEKEECFTLQSGITWCWADPKEKCTVVNGQEQCDSGCGYINGDFVCYESEVDPVIPPDRGEKDPVNDDITDPNKSMADMVKGDFKEVNHGIEQRLNNLITTNENVEIAVDGVKSEVEKTNSKLDGIGKQLDGQGKTLKGIEKGIGDAFGDDGSPDGSCEGDCIGSWYETAYPDGMVGIWEEHSAALQQTPMFEFLDQFQLAPAGNQPDLNICFNLGVMGDFGCSSFDIPAIIWPFIKIVILISAAFLCRALIFGG